MLLERERLLMALRQARTTGDKLEAAADLLAYFGKISSTPEAKREWVDEEARTRASTGQ